MRSPAPALTRALLAATLLATGLAQSGCGLVFGYGEPQPVEVYAKLPSGELVAGLAISNRGNRLPQTSGERVFLHPAEEHSLAIEDPAYRSSQQKVVKKVRVEVAILDALTLGIGLIVDYLSGSLYSVQPQVTISIRAKDEADRLLREAREASRQEPTPSTGVVGQPAAGAKRTDGIWVEDLDSGKKVFLPNDAATCPACDGLRGELQTCPHCGAR